MFWYSLLLLLFSVGLAYCNEDSTCTVLGDINGCSVPLGLPFPYKARFTSACNTHDVCYRCGVKYGWSQAECDQSFLNNMAKSCDSMNTKVTTTTLKATTTSASERRKRGLTDTFSDIFEILKQQLKRDNNEGKNDKSSFTIFKESLQLARLILTWQGKDDNTKEECQAGAEVYYKTVKIFGYSSYRSQSPAFCDEKCARDIGDPKVSL